jgi:hypothetical protein
MIPQRVAVWLTCVSPSLVVVKGSNQKSADPARRERCRNDDGVFAVG